MGDILKINFKKIIFIIIFTIIVGSFFALFTSTNIYSEIVRPKFSPPGIVFPIVWFILYTLMGISFYIVTEEDNDLGNIKIYLLQLFVNSLWTLFFFGFKWFLFSFIWIIILIVLVIIMIIKFYRANKVAGLLQIPYLIWLFIAAYLNLSIYLLN